MIVSMADGLRYAVYVSLSRQTCTGKVRCRLMAVKKVSSGRCFGGTYDFFKFCVEVFKNVIGLQTPVLLFVTFCRVFVYYICGHVRTVSPVHAFCILNCVPPVIFG